MAKIEERILSMRFDNAQFKRAAADTQKDLDKLKKGLKLDGVKSGLDGVAKASSKSLGSITSNASKVNLSPLVQSVDEVGKSFTALEAISFGALASIGGIAVNKAISGVKKLTNMIVNPIMQGGMNRARNLEQANFMLSGLFSKLDDQARKSKIDEVMAAANNSVTGTAFGLDEAAKAAAQLTASQVPLDKLEGSLRGIAGTASMTGSGFEEIANIFTTVAGNGRMMGQELGMLSSRGLNAAASIGEHLGVTEAEVREMASKGKISFEIFSDAMEGAFGAQAARANETYSGSLSNLKAALGRIGADVATVYLEKMRDLFNELRPAVNAVHNVLKPFIGLLNDRFRASIDSVIRPIKTFTTALEQFNETGVSSSKGWTTFFKLMQDIGMITSLVADVVRDAIGVMFGASPRFIEMSDTVTSAGTKIQHIFRKLLSVLMLGPEIIGAIFKAVLGLSDSTGSFGGTLLDIIDHFASMLYLMAEWIRESTIIQSVIGVIAFGIRMVLQVATAAGKVLGFFVGLIAKLYHAMDPVFSGIFGLISKVKGVLESFFGTLSDFSTSVVSKVGKSITTWFGRIFESIKKLDIKDLWSSIKSFKLPRINLSQFKGLEGIISTITGGIDKLKGFVGAIDWSPLANAFRNFQIPNFSDISTFATGVGGQLKTGFNNINSDSIKNFATNVAIQARNAGEFIRNVDYAGIWATVQKTFATGVQATVATLKKFGTWVSDAIRNVDWKAVGSTIVEGFTTAVKMIVNAADSIGTFISDMFTSAMDSVDWGGIVDGFKDFGEGVKESFTGIFDSFKEAKIDTSAVDNAVAASTQDVTVKIEADLETKTKSVKETIGDFFGALFGTGPAISAEDSELIAGTKDFGAKVSSIAGAIKSPFATAKDAVLGEVGSFGDTMKATATGLLEGVNLVEILNGIGLAFTGAGIFSLAESVEKLAAVPEALTGAIKEVGNSFKAMGESFKKIGDAAKIEAQGNAILKIAGAIAILAAAVWFMSKIPWDQMKVGLGAVLGLLAGLVAAVVIMDKTISDEGSAKINDLANAMMKMGIAIGIMAAAIWLLSKLDSETVVSGLLRVLAVVGVLAAGVAIAGLAGTLTGMGTAFIGLALGVGILAGALFLFKFIEWEEIKRGLATLGGAVLIMSAGAWIANGNKLAGAGIAMLGLGAGLLALAYGLKAIAALDEQQLKQGLLVLGGVMLSITLMSKFGGKLAATAGAIVGVAFAMIALAYAIELIADIDFGVAFGSMIAITGGMILLGLAMRAFPKDMPKIAGSLLSIAGAIAILVAAIWVIGNMDTAVVAQGVLVLAGALLSLSIAMAFMKPTAGKDMMILAAGMVVLSGSMLILAVAMKMFNDVDWDGLKKAGVVIAAVVVVIALMGVFGAKAAIGISALGGSLAILGGGLLVIAAAAWVFADAVSKIIDSLNSLKDGGSQIKDALKEVGEGITLFADEAKSGLETLFDTISIWDLPKIGSLVKLLNSFGDIPPGMDVRLKELADGMKSLESAIPIVESMTNATKNGGHHLSSFFNSFSKVDPESGENLKSLASVIRGFDDDFFNILQRLIDLGPTKGDSKELTGFFGAFDNIDEGAADNLLSMYDTLKKFDSDFIDIMQSLIDIGLKVNDAEELRNFFGAFDDIDEGAASKLLSMYDTLKNFDADFIAIMQSLIDIGLKVNDAEELRNFFGAFDDINEDAGSKLLSLSNTLKGFDSDFIAIMQSLIDIGLKESDAEELTSFFGAFDDIGEDAGTKLLSLADTLKHFDTDLITNVQSLIDIGPTKDDSRELVDFFGAFNDINEDAGTKLLSLADTLKHFDTDLIANVQSLIDIGPKESDAEELTNFFGAFDDINEDAGTKLLSLADTLKKFDTDLITNVQSLIDIGPTEDDSRELVDFFGAFNDIDEDAGTKLLSLANTLKEFDSDFIANIQSLIDLGPTEDDARELSDFFGAFGSIEKESGKNLRSLATTLKDFDTDFIEILQSLIDLGPTGQDVNELIGFFGAFDHINEDAGSKLRSLANTLKRFDKDFFTTLQSLIDLGPTGQDIQELTDFFGAFDNINEDAGSKLLSLVNTLKMFDEDFFGILASLTTFEGDAYTVVDLFTSLGGSVSANMGDDISSAVSGIREINEVLPELKTAIETLNGVDVEGLSTMMTNIGEAFNAGIGEGLTGLAEEFRGAIDAALAAITDRSSEFDTAGQELGRNLASGIDITTSDAETAGTNIAEAAATAARNARSSMEASGRYVAEGLAEGIRQGTEAAVTAARTMANRVAAVAREALDEHSPSRVFIEIGQFVSQGFAIGITKDSHLAADAVSNSMDDAINAADIKTGEFKKSTSGFYDTLIKGISNNPLTRRLETLAKHSKAAHATAVKERRIEDMEKLEKAEEERKKIYKDVEEAKKGIAEAKEETKTAQNETKQAEKDTKDAASDSVKSAKEAQKQKEKITDAEEKYQKAIRERDKYEYRMHGEEAGVAFVDGVAVGLMDDREAIPSVAEILSELLVEDVENIKSKVGNFGDIFGGFNTVLKSTKSMRDNIRDIGRAFNRMNNATTSRSMERNMGIILDNIVEFSGGIQDLIGLISVFEPFLPSLLNSFESSLPGIAAVIAPFAPQLAATLGGGLSAALPAIAGPAGAIIAAIAGIGLFLNDQANGGGMLKGLEKMFKGVLKFIASLPKRMLGFIKTMIDGLKQTVKDLPRIITSLMDGMVDFIIAMIDAIPEVIPELVNAIIEVVAWIVLNAPAIILEIGAALIMALVRGLDAAVKSLIRLLLSPFEWLTGKIGGKMDLFGIAVKAVHSLARGFKSAVRASIKLITWPFVQIFNFIGSIFGMSDLGTRLVEDFQNAVVGAMRFALEVITAPFIGVWNLITGIGKSLVDSMFGGILSSITSIPRQLFDGALNLGKSIANHIWNGIKSIPILGPILENLADLGGWIEDKTKDFRSSGSSLGGGIIGGLVNGLVSAGKGAVDGVKNVLTSVWNAGKSFLGINSPSRLFMTMGDSIMEGLGLGMLNSSDVATNALDRNGEDILAVARSIVNDLAYELESDTDFTITPVIDLDGIKKGMGEINDMVNSRNLDITSAINNANELAEVTSGEGYSSGSVTNVTNIEFNQTNTSPEPLSAYEIYQNTDRSLKTLTLSGPNR